MLTKVITAVYFCFLILIKRALADNETDLTNPRTARIGKTVATAAHFSPKTRIINLGNNAKIKAKGNVITAMPTTLFKNAFCKSFD
jgi:hypothetical protein